MMDFIEPFLDEKYPPYDFCDAVADMEYADRKFIKAKLGCPKSWHQIPFDVFIKYREMIYFLPDTMKLYYFPLYMKYLIEKNKESRDWYIDGIFLDILNNKELSVISCKQIESLKKFLEHLKKNKMVDEEEALDEAENRLKIFFGEKCVR